MSDNDGYGADAERNSHEDHEEHTAAAYGNERQVGEAVYGSGVGDLFLETKIWISDY